MPAWTVLMAAAWVIALAVWTAIFENFWRSLALGVVLALAALAVMSRRP
jgi:hypothetical protein